MKRGRRARRAALGRTARSASNAPRRPARGGARAVSAGGQRIFWRSVVCGTIFVALITLKLILPGNLAAMRGTLGAWLVRDADFAEAFSAVGRAVSGAGGVVDSIEDAYVAVFGEGDSRTAEASGRVGIAAEEERTDAPAEDASTPAEGDAAAQGGALDVRALPALAVSEQRILGFDYAAPLAGVRTSDFGWREHPVSGAEAFHYGVDLAADEGTEIDCFADGAVGVVGESTELGKYLTVNHANGFSTLYAHCSRVTANAGSTVKLGEKIAEVGHTGNATGPHLHFEVHDGEEYLNPVYYLS